MTSASRPLVLILVDGLGYRDIADGRAPFLKSELSSGLVRPLTPALGYSDAQRAVLLTGKQPDEIGYWMLYQFALHGGSPWRWLSPLSITDRLGDNIGMRLMKLGLSMSLLRAQGRMAGGDRSIHNMPFRALRWLQPTTSPSAYAGLPIGRAETLLSEASQAGKRWAVIRSDSFSALLKKRSVDDWMPEAKSAIERLHPETGVVFTYLHFPDLFAHRYGRLDEASTREVRRVDKCVPSLMDSFRARLGQNTEFVVVSDHGMSDTHTFLNYSSLVTHPDFGKTFVLALDSTMIRVCYIKESGRRTVHDLLADAPARLLTAGERETFGVSFAPEVFGEDFFLFDDGVSIYPNYHSLMRPLSMHAYDPTLDSQTAFIYTNGTKADGSAAKLANSKPLDMKDVKQILDAVLA